MVVRADSGWLFAMLCRRSGVGSRATIHMRSHRFVHPEVQQRPPADLRRRTAPSCSRRSIGPWAATRSCCRRARCSVRASRKAASCCETARSQPASGSPSARRIRPSIAGGEVPAATRVDRSHQHADAPDSCDRDQRPGHQDRGRRERLPARRTGYRRRSRHLPARQPGRARHGQRHFGRRGNRRIS